MKNFCVFCELSVGELVRCVGVVVFVLYFYEIKGLISS